jgi:DNA-binding beta-propeller fold protein YncE
LPTLAWRVRRICFYSDGKIYIADSGNHRVLVCNPQGSLLSVIGEETLKKPTGVAVADDGTIYVADLLRRSGGRVLCRWY